MTDQGADRILFWWLLLVSLAAAPLGVPAAISALPDVDPLRLWLEAGIETLLLLVPSCAVGVWLGKRVDLGPRLMRDYVLKSPGRLKSTLSMSLPSIVAGVVLAIPLFLGGGPGISGPTTIEIVLRALSVGFTEEILFRLGLMTLFAWILRSMVNKPSFARSAIDLGNVLAAILFALAHLIGNVTPETFNWNLVIGILGFNFIAGAVMGWLYGRYGLLSAVVAHFVADVVGYAAPGMF